MLIITFEVDAPAERILGIKEDLAMHLEKYGDVKAIRVVEEVPVQIELKRKGNPYENQR